MKQVALVFLGGGMGSILRYGISLYFSNQNHLFPKATFLANVIGALLIGVLIGYQLKHQTSNGLSLFLVTGFCGGFTTFSTFSLESYNLWKAEEWSTLGIYLSASLLIGILLTGIGIAIAQRL